MVDAATMSLRERKRLTAMRRIQAVALDLFEAHGFEQVTIERVAEAAEVSPSSVYRYFGTKEHIVIWDEYDPRALAEIAEELHHHPPIEAVRRVVEVSIIQAMGEDEEQIRRRMRLSFSNPTIEAAATQQAYEMAGLIAALLAERGAPEMDDLDVQVFAHAFVGGLLGGLRHWYRSDFTTPLRDVVERPLGILERGLVGSVQGLPRGPSRRSAPGG